MKKWIVLVTMLAMVLGLVGTALAQELTDETATPETTTPETTAPETTTDEATPPQEVAQEAVPASPAPAAPAFTLGADGTSVDRTDGATVTNIPCFDAFRDEQEELAVTGTYPTIASDAARACEGFGIANPYPAPYFYDTDGFLYTYDPIEGIYSSDPDPATGVVYIYSQANGAFYTYDPATGAYL